MTDKEFRRLSRSELIDIIYELQKQNEQYKQQTEKLQNALDEKELRITKAGSIAEAALSLSGVFEAAQVAADTYLKSIISASELTQQRIAEAEEYRRRIISEAHQEAANIIRDTSTQSAAEENVPARNSCGTAEKK